MHIPTYPRYLERTRVGSRATILEGRQIAPLGPFFINELAGDFNNYSAFEANVQPQKAQTVFNMIFNDRFIFLY